MPGVLNSIKGGLSKIKDKAAGAYDSVKTGAKQAAQTAAIAAATAAAGAALAAEAAKPADRIPLSLYRGLAAFPVTGLLGLDHFAAGSMETAFTKLLVNLLTFGSWYVYDMLYSINGPAVVNEGLKIPFLEIVSVKPGIIDEAATLTDKTKIFLYALLTSVSGLICGISYIFREYKAVLYLMMGSAIATLGMATYTVFQLRSYVMKSVMSAIPGGSLLSKFPLSAMMGGGDPAELSKHVTLDFFVLATLFVLAVTGFALSSIRSKVPPQSLETKTDGLPRRTGGV